MAYFGTTAASSVRNEPARLAGTMGGTFNTASTGGTGGQLWMWNSSNGTTDAFAANYFVDALKLGMKKGDIIMMQGCTGTTVNLLIGVLGAVTSDGAALASTGSFISSSFT